MGKLGKICVWTTSVVVIIAGMLLIQSQGQNSLYTTNFDVDHLSRVKKIPINQLRNLIQSNLTHEYMLEDAYLLKWLSLMDFKVKESAKLLQENLEWREEQSINSILDEDWNDMHSKFPYNRDTKDRFGRPVLYFDIGEWDIVKLVTEQKSTDQLERYFYKLLEETEAYVRGLRSEGQNVTQFVLIINFADYSVQKHGCIQCVHSYRNIGQVLPSKFPRTAERITFVNVPYLFEVVYAYLSNYNKRVINILGEDQVIWEAQLSETIDKDQIPVGLLNRNNKYHN